MYQFNSRVQGFIQQITSNPHLWITRQKKSFNAQVIHMLDKAGTLSGESPSRAHREPLRRRARGVAFVIGISLSFGISPADGISNVKYYDLHSLADYQLTDKQLHCHNQIVFRESSNNRLAVNKYNTAFGYYQLKNKRVKNAPYDYQFHMYWHYVAKRYGITRYDEPNYCAALAHLKRKGWQ